MKIYKVTWSGESKVPLVDYVVADKINSIQEILEEAYPDIEELEIREIILTSINTLVEKR